MPTNTIISEDWIKGNIRVPVNFNLYNYCWNSPLNYVDRNGKKGYYFFSDNFDDRDTETDVDSDIAQLEERFDCEVECQTAHYGRMSLLFYHTGSLYSRRAGCFLSCSFRREAPNTSFSVIK